MDFENFFRGVLAIKDEELVREFAGGATQRVLAKGECVLLAGDIQTEVSFLVSGIARTYSIDADGRDVTECIVSAPGAALAPSPNLAGRAVSSVEMIVVGEVVSVGIPLIERLLKTSLAANQLYSRLVCMAWQEHWEVRRLLSQKRGRERYLWFLDRYGDIVDKVPNRYVASLLGMTPVSLSRLRSELKSEGVLS